MHRGFNYYYREGLKSSGKTVYRNRCFFRYILYFLAEFFGRLFIVFNLHFNIADIRQGYVIRKKNVLGFSSSFSGIRRIGTYLLTICFEALILLAGIAAAAVLAVILGSIGYGVAKIASYEDFWLFILMFAAPAALLGSLYVLVSLLIFSPTAYIIANNEGVSAGETIGACYKTMLNSGKMTVFSSYFVSTLLKSLYLGVMGTGGYFVITLFVPQSYFVLALIGWITVTLAIYLTFAPILTLTNRVVKEHLFEDIVLDPVTAARVNEKLNLAVCNGKRLQPEVTPQNLASLFEYTEDPYRILTETEKKSKLLETAATEKKKKRKAPSEKKAAKKEVKAKEEEKEAPPVSENPQTAAASGQPISNEQPTVMEEAPSQPSPTVNPQPPVQPASSAN